MAADRPGEGARARWSSEVELFLCGDVMTGRGIDQILAHPCEPAIYEPGTSSALTYVALAERAGGGPIPRAVAADYVWGDALSEIVGRPDARIINLETSVTTSGFPFPKGINYRMHPENVPCLVAAGIDCCSLANNHVMDWGVEGLLETLETLEHAGIRITGAGRCLKEALRPAVVEMEGRRVLVCGLGSATSGIPESWGATEKDPGVALLRDFSNSNADAIAGAIGNEKRPRDVAVVSIHWGGNWGYDIPVEQRSFAHRLVDSGEVDIVHGHSSHHAKGIEVYRGRLILYGCGDFVTDYEGIAGYGEYSPELAVAYFCSMDANSGELAGLEMAPFRSHRFRLRRGTVEEGRRLARTLQREGRALGTQVEEMATGALKLRW
ncbi:MAG: poly-gamma-glutamate biosynthesis protein [Anaerolinea sp.]|nr:poly-gamma-glutamate biosynthesis protein [Anaerolinea sp.]